VIRKIISGGQTGADRAALDVAIQKGIPRGGWCPKGRLAEDGTIPWGYTLNETPSSDYEQRTEWNVRDSDATVIFSIGAELNGGSILTKEFTMQYGKPCIHISQQRDGESGSEKLSAFLRDRQITCLNVAGPRTSEEPGIGGYVTETLSKVISH